MEFHTIQSTSQWAQCCELMVSYYECSRNMCVVIYTQAMCIYHQ